MLKNFNYKQLIIMTRNQSQYNKNDFNYFLFIIPNTMFALKKVFKKINSI